jgi:hypothetical protein
MTPSRSPLRVALLALSLAAACGTEGTQGSAPVITDLTLDPTTVALGTSTLTARFTVNDADLDANAFLVHLTGPDRVTRTLGPSTITNLAGRNNVVVMARISLILNAAGAYTVELQVNDLAGHGSNRLGGTVTAN